MKTNEWTQKKYVLSEWQNRREFLIETNQNNCMTRRIGNTTYQVKVYLSENATETFQDKLLWLVRHDSTLKSERTDYETEKD